VDIFGNRSLEVTHAFETVSCDGTGVLCSIVGVDPTLYSFTSSDPLRVPIQLATILALDEQTGTLYVSDLYACRIYRVTAQGAVTHLLGTGTCAFSPNGSNLSSSPINLVGGLAFYRFPDGKEYLYFSETQSHCIRRVEISPGPPTVTTVAGQCNSSGFTDGATNSARFNAPYGITVSPELAGSHPEIFVADTGNHRIRRISGGTVATLAGNGTPTNSNCSNLGDNGPALSATFNSPYAVAIQGTNLLVADTSNQLIRTVPRAGGNIVSIAGQCRLAGYNDNVQAGSARLYNPRSLYVDPYRGGYWIGNQYGILIWVDGFSVTSTIHQAFPPPTGVNLNFGDYRGRAEAFYGEIWGVAGDQDGIYFGTLRAVKRLVLNGGLGDRNYLLPILGPSNDQYGIYPDLPGSQAPLGLVHAVTVSTQGDLAYLESGIGAKVVVVKDGVARKVADLSGGADLEWDPSGLTLYVASVTQHKIYKVSVLTRTASLLAGSTQGYQEGTGSTARFNGPRGLWLDPVNRVLYVADTGNHCIRKVNPDTGATALVAGNCGNPGNVPNTTTGPVDLGNLFLNNPWDLVGDPSANPPTLYVADTLNYKVRLILQAQDQAYTLMGTGTQGYCLSGSNFLQPMPILYSIGLDPRPIYSGGKALLLPSVEVLYRVPLNGGSFQAVAGGCFRHGFYGHRDLAIHARLSFYYLTHPIYHPPVPGVFPTPGYLIPDQGVGRIYRISDP
jgi:hypothetical protein